MRKLKQALFYISFIFFSCGQTQQKETKKEQDTLSQGIVKTEVTVKSKYQPLDMDTLVSEKEILIDNESFNLKIIKYCHNDSAVVNEVWLRDVSGVTHKEFDISHNYSTQIILAKNNEITFDKQISKDILKDHLIDQGYFRKEMLYDIQYDFVKANRLYFKATLVAFNTNWIEEIEFALFYQTEKAGQIDFTGTAPDWVTYNDLELYDLTYHDKSPTEKVGFTSLSDNYPLSEHPDSLAIPDLYTIEGDEYFKLASKYRKRFLTKTKISETDTVFVYNYYSNTLVSFKVKNLAVVACLNIYANENDKPYSQDDYMFGFEIDKNVLKDFGINFYQTLIYVGKENPFVQGQLKPIAWKKIEQADFPSKPISTKNTLLLRTYQKGNTYKYEATNFEYFTQDLLKDNSISGRRLLVIDGNTKETVHDIFYFNSEGTGLAPLNLTTDNDKNYNQWTGGLFKNKPPVIFGFEFISFGCPSITFLKKSVGAVGINCDNRH